MKILHLTEKIYTGTACGACDKYEVCINLCLRTQFHPTNYHIIETFQASLFFWHLDVSFSFWLPLPTGFGQENKKKIQLNTDLFVINDRIVMVVTQMMNADSQVNVVEQKFDWTDV